MIYAHAMGPLFAVFASVSNVRVSVPSTHMYPARSLSLDAEISARRTRTRRALFDVVGKKSAILQQNHMKLETACE